MTMQEWLEQRLARQAQLSLVASVLAMLGGVVVVFVTFWLVYVVIWLVFGWFLPMPHSVRMIASVVVVVLLFIGNLRTAPGYLEEVPLRELPFDFPPLTLVTGGDLEAH